MDVVERPSVCTYDCPDTCSLTVTVDSGRITKVRGSKANPFTDGVICNKVAHDTSALVHGPQRLTRPLKRVGPKGSGQFAPVGWDEALDTVRDRTRAVIERWGPQAVLPLNYAGPHGLLAYDSMSLRFFHKLGATLLSRRPLCGGVRAEAWAGTYGAAPGIPPEMAEDAQLVVVWGNNATACNLHLVRRIRRAQKKGAKLVVVDPRRIKVAEQADLHLPLLPGTDVLLGFAVAVELERRGAIDQAFVAASVLGHEAWMARAREWPPERAALECGLEVGAIRQFARLIAESAPVVFSIGNGLERCRTGGSGVRAAIALPALAGKLGAGKGGIVLGAGNAFAKTAAKLHRPDLVPAGTRTVNILDVGRHLADDDLDPPIRALFVYNHNPAVVHPDQNRMLKGLAREEIFAVGVEVAMTDSMAYCDIVLPAATHLESDDIYPAYGTHWLQRAEPVIPPVGESLPNTEIFRRLAARFGFEDPCFKASDAELMDDAIDPADPRLKGTRPSALSTRKALAMTAPDGRPFVLFDNVRPATPSGKVELASETLAKRWGKDALLPAWKPLADAPGALRPLTLISPASDRRISSSFGGLHLPEGAPPLLMNPTDATARGLKSGQQVKVSNALGEVVLPLKVTDSVCPGVVSSEKGAWLGSGGNRRTVSALAPADLRADLSEGACYNDARVEV
ncbi:MAG: molybdopterin-dependent oxidoreductase, partial [Alphaproteobacteria bacterium]|nr:molybdopterin-dependent oxidoreductase [Alphaproteobacteria bacterium]